MAAETPKIVAKEQLLIYMGAASSAVIEGGGNKGTLLINDAGHLFSKDKRGHVCLL